MTVSFSAVATTKLVSIRRPIAAFLHGQGGCCFLSIDWDRPEGRRNIRFAWCRRVAFSGGPTRSGKQPPTKIFVRKRPQDVIQYTLHTYFFKWCKIPCIRQIHSYWFPVFADKGEMSIDFGMDQTPKWWRMCPPRCPMCLCMCFDSGQALGDSYARAHVSRSSETDASFQKDHSNTWQLFFRLFGCFTL